MSKLYSSKKIIQILLNHGFVLVSQKGSHKKFKKDDRTVIVPDPKKEIPWGTFVSILRQSGLSKRDFEG
jgi:predicted RNA binding protein YcfA (HicA-like mRNA interferase family)